MYEIHSRTAGRVGGMSIYGETFTRQQGILQRMILYKTEHAASAARRILGSVGRVVRVRNSSGRGGQSCQTLV